MKKIITFILMVMILINESFVAYAEPVIHDFHDIFEENGSIMLLIEAETGKIEDANKAAADFYGYTIEQLKSMNIDDINTLEADSIQEQMKSAVNNDNHYFVFEHKLKSGEIRTVEVYSCPHTIGDRELLFSIIYDITDEVYLERKNKALTYSLTTILFLILIFLILFIVILNNNLKEIREKNEQIEAFNELKESFIDSYDNLIYLKDEYLKYVFINKAVKEFYNREESQIIGYGDFEICDKELAEKIHDINLAALEKGTTIKTEINFNDRVYRTINFPVKLPNNKYGVGAYVEDITERKEQMRRIEYMSSHDALTGLYNRMFFEEELKKIDIGINLPISVIVADVNGLKLTNDIFGHDAGDELLKKVAEILKKVCRADDIIARVGGDEFVILLPKTAAEGAEKIISRIKNEFSKEKVKAIKGSISLGCDTKSCQYEDINQVKENAETKMYSEKALDRSEAKSTTIKTIIEELHRSYPEEEEHARYVSRICERIGVAMDLSKDELKKLKEVSFYHDIGNIALDEKLLKKTEKFTEQEQKEIMQHTVAGFRILNSFDDTMDLAQSVLYHHERWDGTGYPKRLKGEEIPKLARIIAVAEYYEEIRNGFGGKTLDKEEIIHEIRRQSGLRLDPKIVDIFVRILMDDL